MMLTVEPKLESPDDFYEALLAAHQGLSLDQSHDLNARLVLVLANQIGRQDLLQQALDVTRASLQGAPND
ncbi:MAG: DUF2783 domain-containing protein [Rubrivivax sp.]|jgi:hypothetical protein|nr:DUF2783 domain-containing protein [Rubrivivax sp.]MBK7264271.1 DUF2783 domain-containing protein [Rubrivivax sp.]MBK8527781.1 DUF2783 domain-containing protein [Rubrivivax sp.]